MLHHAEIDRREDLIHHVRAALDAHGLAAPGYDAAGDLDHASLELALEPLGYRFANMRQTLDSAWRATFIAPDGRPVSADAYSREDALAAAVVTVLEGIQA